MLKKEKFNVLQITIKYWGGITQTGTTRVPKGTSPKAALAAWAESPLHQDIYNLKNCRFLATKKVKLYL